MQCGSTVKSFAYNDKGSMAIIGRSKAAADIPKPKMHIKGFIAWAAWLFVHLFSLINYRNRIVTMYNWTIAYFTRDQSLRMIIRPRKTSTSNQYVFMEKNKSQEPLRLPIFSASMRQIRLIQNWQSLLSQSLKSLAPPLMKGKRETLIVLLKMAMKRKAKGYREVWWRFDRLLASDAFIIASPGYNGSMLGIKF